MLYRPEHPNAKKNGYISQHRFVMSNHLGRTLLRTEEVHHKNENRSDNRLRNLQLCSHAEHRRLHKSKAVCRKCGQPQRCKNLCVKHYKESVEKKARCKCGRQVWPAGKSKVKCRKCYLKARRGKAKSKRCSVCKSRGQITRGYCRTHYLIHVRNPVRRLQKKLLRKSNRRSFVDQLQGS